MKHILIWQDNQHPDIGGGIKFETFANKGEMTDYFKKLVEKYQDYPDDLSFLFAGEIIEEYRLEIKEVIKKFNFVNINE
jgi:hypothetical protein